MAKVVDRGYGDKTMQKLRQTIHDAVYQLYAASGRGIIPRFGYVLIYVLPKERMTSSGLIHIPEGQQNKPVYEGIVVQTYEPRIKTLLLEDKETKKMYPKEFIYESEVSPGDHVLFPHYEGMPVGWFLDEKEFRIITEEQIRGKIEYREKDENLREVKAVVVEHSNYQVEEVSKALLEKFHIVRRTEKPRTLSGV